MRNTLSVKEALFKVAYNVSETCCFQADFILLTCWSQRRRWSSNQGADCVSVAV